MTAALRAMPSVDVLLRSSAGAELVRSFGHARTVEALRVALGEERERLRKGEDATGPDPIVARAADDLKAADRASLRPVFNLTGTVLHTNLGRAQLAEVAIEAASSAMREAVTLEFDLESGGRGERDDHLRALLCELTGAEDATSVNNNAAAVLLVLNALAGRGEGAVVSRGELIEIGGAFRMPDIMARAGARLIEVGTTNRTHEKDYHAALGEPGVGLVMKVHTSNYRIEGFTKEVHGPELSRIARAAGVPFVNDLGSGTLLDLSRFGMRREPTVAEAVAEGADLVTFSGDKLLGGPQAGFIVGRKDLIAKINRNPMKRALRLDKMRIAALEATLKLYRDPGRLAERLPTLRFLSRQRDEIAALAQRMRGPVAQSLGGDFSVEVAECQSQIGSGALPTDTIPSAGLAIRSTSDSGRALDRLATALRALPRPVIGRIADGALLLDLRCLEDEDAFLANLGALGNGAA